MMIWEGLYKGKKRLYLSGEYVFSSNFSRVRLLYHYLCQWRPLWNISDCKHPVRVRRWSLSTVNPVTPFMVPHSLQALLPTSTPLHFYLATNFHSHRNSLCGSLLLSCNSSERERERKKTTCLAHCLFLGFSLSPLLNFTSPLLGLFLSLSYTLCVRLLEAARESSASFLTHWLISARPSLGSAPTPTGDPGAGEKQEVGCVWWRQFTGGVVWLRLLGPYCQAQPMPISKAGDMELLLP